VNVALQCILDLDLELAKVSIFSNAAREYLRAAGAVAIVQL